jgi:hypothetical protein
VANLSALAGVPAQGILPTIASRPSAESETQPQKPANCGGRLPETAVAGLEVSHHREPDTGACPAKMRSFTRGRHSSASIGQRVSFPRRARDPNYRSVSASGEIYLNRNVEARVARGYNGCPSRRRWSRSHSLRVWGSMAMVNAIYSASSNVMAATPPSIGSSCP